MVTPAVVAFDRGSKGRGGGKYNPDNYGCRRKAALLVALAIPFLPLLLVLVPIALLAKPKPQDNGERPEGHFVGYRWRTNPPGDWWPGSRNDDSAKDDAKKAEPGRWRRANRRDK